MMIYVVSGYMRSGTSMMMRALEAGGLEAAYAPDRRQFYEIQAHETRMPGFHERYDGKLVKVFFHNVVCLPVHQYRVVFMRRSPDAIAKSWVKSFRSRSPRIVRDGLLPAMLDEAIAVSRERPSFMTVDEVWLEDLVLDPVGVFTRLDWPIDVAKAAAIPAADKVRSGF